mgnify:CR=1 FL=1
MSAVANILTYHGNAFHTGLNYSVFALCLLPFCYILLHPRSRSGRNGLTCRCCQLKPADTEPKTTRPACECILHVPAIAFLLCTMAFWWAFQISVCDRMGMCEGQACPASLTCWLCALVWFSAVSG